MSRRLTYIQAVGHSGSTLLARLLNLHPGIHSIGSFREIELLGSDDKDAFCGCSLPPLECPVWQSILEEFGSNPRPGMFRATDGTMTARQEKESQRFIDSVLRATSAESVCELTHDGRRIQKYLQKNSEEVLFIHLVRDPRAVLRSYFRLIEPAGFLARFILLLRISIFYFRRNVWSMLIGRYYRRKGGVYIRIRYEDVCGNMDKEIGKVFDQLGLPRLKLAKRFAVEDNHIIGGNVVRLKPLVTVKDDQPFLSYFSKTMLLVQSIVNLPMLILFRYPLLPSSQI